MHDPMVVLFDVNLPIPRRQKYRERENGPRWTLGRRRFTNAENFGEPVYAWWRPVGWNPVVFGRFYAWQRFATVWHHEPGERDAGEVCKDIMGGGSSFRLRHIPRYWNHRRHLSVQVHPYAKLMGWLFTRCAECGRRFFWRDGHHGYWGGDRVYHSECMSVRHLRHQLDDAAKALSFTANDTERWRVERWLKEREQPEREGTVKR